MQVQDVANLGSRLRISLTLAYAWSVPIPHNCSFDFVEQINIFAAGRQQSAGAEHLYSPAHPPPPLPPPPLHLIDYRRRNGNSSSENVPVGPKPSNHGAVPHSTVDHEGATNFYEKLSDGLVDTNVAQEPHTQSSADENITESEKFGGPSVCSTISSTCVIGQKVPPPLPPRTPNKHKPISCFVSQQQESDFETAFKAPQISLKIQEAVDSGEISVDEFNALVQSKALDKVSSAVAISLHSRAASFSSSDSNSDHGDGDRSSIQSGTSFGDDSVGYISEEILRSELQSLADEFSEALTSATDQLKALEHRHKELEILLRSHRAHVHFFFALVVLLVAGDIVRFNGTPFFLAGIFVASLCFFVPPSMLQFATFGSISDLVVKYF